MKEERTHTRNQRRMYRIHKLEEKIHNQDLLIGSLQSQLKAKEDNWNKLKQDIGYELLKLREPNEYNNGLVNGINYVLNTMQELEILSKGENK